VDAYRGDLCLRRTLESTAFFWKVTLKCETIVNRSGFSVVPQRRRLARYERTADTIYRKRRPKSWLAAGRTWRRQDGAGSRVPAQRRIARGLFKPPRDYVRQIECAHDGQKLKPAGVPRSAPKEIMPTAWALASTRRLALLHGTIRLSPRR
jgi:hypothetical protein